jgi:hypothetical protein
VASREASRARTRAGDDDDDDDDGDKPPASSIYGKTWNKRTVAAHLYREQVKAERAKLIAQGKKDLAAYQPALTAVYSQLTAEQEADCVEKAKEWNEGTWPRELQLRFVITL